MPPRAAQPGRPKDERKEFFRDLAALRARRGLTLADIAGRTQFPVVSLAAVESGPEVPPLPALEAYLRGCGEPLAAWRTGGAGLTGAPRSSRATEICRCERRGRARSPRRARRWPEPRPARTRRRATRWSVARTRAAGGDPAPARRRLAGRRTPSSDSAPAVAGGGRSACPGGAPWPRQPRRSRRPGGSAARYRAHVCGRRWRCGVARGGGAALLAWGHAAGHRGVAGGAPRSAGPGSAGTPSAGVPTAGVPTAGMPSAGGGVRPAPAHRTRHHGSPTSPVARPPVARPAGGGGWVPRRWRHRG